MILFLLSAAQGPSECCLAVSLAAKQLSRDAVKSEVAITLVESEQGLEPQTYKSMLFKLEGAKAEDLAKQWSGTLQWICSSPYRPKHRRKNWFFTGSFTKPEVQSKACIVKEVDLIFEACRSSGPGGQHANKTSSAIRASHVPSGIVVKVESERSQHANKRLAIALIEHKLEKSMAEKQRSDKSKRRLQHHSIERGNADRIFKGMKFEESSSPKVN